jgi:hypothetical protein
MHHFRNFLCLATQESTYPQTIVGITDVNPDSSLVEIFYQLDTSPTFVETDVFNSLFSFKDIEYKFDTCLKNWYTKYEMLEPICQLYFGSYYGRFVYVDLKFLSLVQALESYHRIISSNEELPKPEHQTRINNILNAVPINYRSWLKYKLKYSNEPTLQKRLQDLFNKFNCSINTLVPNQEVFIRKIVDTRNYMAHRDVNLKNKTVSNKELFVITERLRILVETCLLNEIGFNLDEIKSILCKRYERRLRAYEK